jgi:hypothetical protein
MAFWQWSKTAATNAGVDPSINWAEGMPPAQVNDSGRAMMARSAEYRDDTSGLLVTTGTATAYAVTTNQGLPSPPNDGQLIVVSFHTANGASATLSADGGTAFPIQDAPGTGLFAGGIVPGIPIPLKFRTASLGWIMMGCGTASIALAASSGSITNFALSNMAAWTLKGNPTGSSATPTDFTIDSLTAKASPLAADEVPIWDAAGTAMKKATLASLAAAIGAAPTVQRFTSGTSLTYTPTAGMVRIKVRMCGGGGGGGAAHINNGSNGTASSFGGWGAAAGAGGGTAGGAPGAGGTGGSNGTGTLVYRVAGGSGNGGLSVAGSVSGQNAGGGGSNPFGGAGGGAQPAAAGIAAAANSGGGGGGGNQDNGGGTGSAGGGAGEFVEFWMTAAQVGASQTYTVGTGGNGGPAGTQAGGNGAAGQIIVEESYI